MKVEVILPKGSMFDLSRFLNSKRVGSRAVAEAAKRDFQSSVASWDEKPDFDIIDTDESFIVGTDDELYALVNNGSDPHVILPRRRKRLAFQTEYRSKTVPGSINSRSGGKSGDVVTSRGVMHPGFAARKFDVTVLKRTERTFIDKMINAVIEGNK